MFTVVFTGASRPCGRAAASGPAQAGEVSADQQGTPCKRAPPDVKNSPASKRRKFIPLKSPAKGKKGAVLQRAKDTVAKFKALAKQAARNANMSHQAHNNIRFCSANSCKVFVTCVFLVLAPGASEHKSAANLLKTNNYPSATPTRLRSPFKGPPFCWPGRRGFLPLSRGLTVALCPRGLTVSLCLAT